MIQSLHKPQKFPSNVNFSCSKVDGERVFVSEDFQNCNFLCGSCGHGAVTVPQQDQTQTDEDTRQGWERFASPEGLGLIVVLRSCAFHFGKNRLVVGHLRDSMNPEHNVSLRSLRDDSVAGTDHGRSSAQRSVAVPPPLWTDLLILCTSKSNSRKHTPVLRLWFPVV